MPERVPGRVALTHTYLLLVAEYLRDELLPAVRALVEGVGEMDAQELMAKLDELDRVVDVTLAGIAQSKAQAASDAGLAAINAQAVTDAKSRVAAVIDKLNGSAA